MANSYVFYANKNGRPTGLPGFVGPKGPQGEQGEQGIQGLQGDPGVFIGSEEDMPAGTRVRLDPNGSPDIAAVINDTNISEDETWSSSKINRDLAELTNNDWEASNEIDITSRTYQNPYTTATSGYAFISNASGQSGLLRVASATKNTNFAVGGGVGRFGIYIKKGMKVYTEGATTKAVFIEC